MRNSIYRICCGLALYFYFFHILCLPALLTIDGTFHYAKAKIFLFLYLKIILVGIVTIWISDLNLNESTPPKYIVFHLKTTVLGFG